MTESTFVEEAMRIAESACTASAIAVQHGTEHAYRTEEMQLAALRAHLEAREALVKQMAEALEIANEYSEAEGIRLPEVFAALTAYREATK